MRLLFRCLAVAVIGVLAAACNLQPITAPTPTPPPTPQPLEEEGDDAIVVFVTATPFGVPPPAGSTSTSTSANWFINTVVLPAWNFVYSLFLQTAGALWVTAGAQGGIFAQVACCIVPGLIVVALIIRRLFYGRRYGLF